MVKNVVKNVNYFTNFINVCKKETKYPLINFPSKLQRFPSKSKNFPGMRLPNSTLFPCMDKKQGAWYLGHPVNGNKEVSTQIVSQ